MIRKAIQGAAIGTAALALGACATMQNEATGLLQASYDAELTGNGVAGAGNPDGYAIAQITVTEDTDAICYNIRNVRNIGTATGAHIHRAPAGENGPVIVPLERGEGDGWDGCIESSDLTGEMLSADPTMFYVQIHTSEFPAGAIRGQLRYD